MKIPFFQTTIKTIAAISKLKAAKSVLWKSGMKICMFSDCMVSGLAFNTIKQYENISKNSVKFAL